MRKLFTLATTYRLMSNNSQVIFHTSECILIRMNRIIVILGRQPELGLVELESLFGTKNINPLNNNKAALLSIQKSEFPMSRVGGTIKAASFISEIPTTDWKKVESYIIEILPKLIESKAVGKKISLGVSTYGFGMRVGTLNTSILSIKKGLKLAKSIQSPSLRIIPNKELSLNSAQIIHNRLISSHGLEIIIINNGKNTIIGQSISVQDIESYATRDYGRPFRDTRVGMLPPKLAQIIINLAISNRDSTKEEIHVFDPFCGTGVVLQEALLMGLFAMGADLNSRMVQYTTQNLHWLYEKFNYSGMLLNVDVADATSARWTNPFDTIACETFLGRPFSAEPKPESLNQVIRDVDTIHRKFLRNVTRHPNVISATENGREFRMCIAVPVWKTKTGFRHLPVLDELRELGYTRVSFVHAGNKDLIYHREGQIVARELVVLTRHV